jgi:hypothetical protein
VSSYSKAHFVLKLLTYPQDLSVLALSIARSHQIGTLLSASDARLAGGNVIIFQEIDLTFSLATTTLMAEGQAKEQPRESALICDIYDRECR